MLDNSDWLTRLLIRQKSQHIFLPSLWRFLIYNKKLTTASSLLWLIVLILVMIESLSTIGIIDYCFSPLIIFKNYVSTFQECMTFFL